MIRSHHHDADALNIFRKKQHYYLQNNLGFYCNILLVVAHIRYAAAFIYN